MLPSNVSDYLTNRYVWQKRRYSKPNLLRSSRNASGYLQSKPLPKPLPTHRLVWGAMLATVFFVAATAGLRVYLQYITHTGYTYGALAAPIAFLLFAFFLGFAIMIGAELNAAIEEEWPAPEPHLSRWLTQLRHGRDAVSPS